MTAQQFADLQEALLIALGNLASWWLVMAFVSSVILSLSMVGLAFARFLLGRRVGIPQSYNPVR